MSVTVDLNSYRPTVFGIKETMQRYERPKDVEAAHMLGICRLALERAEELEQAAPTPQAQVTEEIVERGAKALYAKGLRSEPWEITYEIYRISHRNDARIVLESALSALPAREDVEELIAALEPFAAMLMDARCFPGVAEHELPEDDDCAEMSVRLGDLRRAAQALARVRGEKE